MTDLAPTDEELEAIRERAGAAVGLARWAAFRAKDAVLLKHDIHTLLSALAAEKKRADEAEALVYAPGRWKCAKCNFTLQQANLNARDGTVTARDKAGDECPNCASPLWRVSWKTEAQENMDIAEAQWARAVAAESELTALRARVAELEGALTPFAERATRWEENHPVRSVHQHRDSTQITHRLGDFRAARKTLGAAND